MISIQLESYNYNEALKRLIEKTIVDHPGKSVCEIAEIIGIGKSSLYRYIYQFGIKMPSKKVA